MPPREAIGNSYMQRFLKTDLNLSQFGKPQFGGTVNTSMIRKNDALLDDEEANRTFMDVRRAGSSTSLAPVEGVKFNFTDMMKTLKGFNKQNSIFGDKSKD